MTSIAGLASNRGRNLLNIAERRPGGAELVVVVSNQDEAPVLANAATRDIDTAVVEQTPEMSRRDHERAVLDALDGYDIDVVLLDGYMRILSETFLDGVPLTLNVHPSLLPSFPGMDAHEQVLEAGVAVTGCTIHVVTDAVADDGTVREADVDAGPIVTQEPVPVYADDDPQSLKERVLYDAEFKAYSRAVRWVAEDRLTVAGDEVTVEEDTAGSFPERRVSTEDRSRDLRYGENPHQDAALYADHTAEEPSVVHADQLNPGAKALSYNNYNDADAALDLIKEFEDPAAAVIKHTNPAGCAVGEAVADAYDRALATDAKSAFGGIVALNRPCSRDAAEQIVESYKEAVVAPGYTQDGLAVLRESDDLRVLDVGQTAGEALGGRAEELTEKPLVGGRLVQERDRYAPTADDLEIVTEREPTEAEIETMLFAWRTLKHVKSNGIVLATGQETVGIGMGQVSRVDAVTLAAMKAEKDAEGKSAEGSVMASDAFFPFRDGIDEAASADVSAVIQPGGSVNDDEVIDAADEHDMAMAFTGTRCFRHD